MQLLSPAQVEEEESIFPVGRQDKIVEADGIHLSRISIGRQCLRWSRRALETAALIVGVQALLGLIAQKAKKHDAKADRDEKPTYLPR